jgi:hypothetical protein
MRQPTYKLQQAIDLQMERTEIQLCCTHDYFIWTRTTMRTKRPPAMMPVMATTAFTAASPSASAIALNPTWTTSAIRMRSSVSHHKSL